MALHTFQLTGIEANCRQTTVDHPVGSNTYTVNVFCLPPSSGTIYYTENSQFRRISSMTAIGGDTRTFGPSYVHDFSVSPDGEQIAYQQRTPLWDRGDDIPHIFIMSTDGSNQVQLTGSTGIGSDANDWRDFSPTWSPDGLRIAYAASFRLGSTLSVFVINSDGTGFVQISGNGPSDQKPDWSPDGTRIPFGRSGPATGQGIYIMTPDGSDVARLTDSTGGFDWDPSWSPAGSRIAFVRLLEDWTIFVMNADGTGVQQLTSLASGCDASSMNWSPDGSWMVFEVGCGESSTRPFSIYVMREDGTDVVQLGVTGTEPHWVR